MLVIQAKNVNDAYNSALWAIKLEGVEENTRNGPARVFPRPVTTHYRKPLENMLFDNARDANPFFHVMESIWMLAGSNALEVPAWYAANIRMFSDDGLTLNGAYGHRWRNYFYVDQLKGVINSLKNNGETRRAVLAMWDPSADLQSSSLDLPCNTHI